MSFLRHLSDHAFELAVTLLSLGVVVLVLYGAGTDGSIINLVVVVLLAAECVRQLIAYLYHRTFWRSVEDQVDQADQNQGSSLVGLSDLVDEPTFQEGQIAWGAFDAMGREAQARVDRVSADALDYRSFVEAWVHEVKTPIAAARLITENSPGRLSSDVSRELGRIDGYVEQALYYARSSSLERDYAIRELVLEGVVRNAVRAHARTLIDASMSVGTSDLDQKVFTDAKWLGFVLGQLIENAAKYRVLPGEDRSPQLSFSAARQGEGRANECVVLTVEDNGRGIPAQDLPRVFDKGFVGENGRTSSAGKSTGIGLFLVKRLCDKMGLTVSASSRRGAWTRISISFPTNRAHYVDALS